MSDTYIFEQIINVIHAEIRKVDASGVITMRYGKTPIDYDPFCMDPQFLNDVLKRKQPHIPDLFCEKDCLLHNRITQSCKAKMDIVACPNWT